MNIVQGDNGISIPFMVNKERNKTENLTNAVVRVAVKQGTDINVKQAIIANAQSGRCELVLSTADLAVIGAYSYQWTAYFSDGRIYSGKPVSFTVTEVFVSVDGGDDPSETFILPFATKGDVEEVQAKVDELRVLVGEGGTGQKGEQGPQGIQGIAGQDGKDGKNGPKGDKGDKGDTGAKGDKGDSGVAPEIITNMQTKIDELSALVQSIIDGGITPNPIIDPIYLVTGGEGYAKSGSWQSSSLKAYNDSPTDYSQVVDSNANWTAYAPKDGNYEIYVWYPVSTGKALVDYSIVTPLGVWKMTIDQAENGGNWYKLATIGGQGGAGISVKITTKAGNTARTGAVQILHTIAVADEPSPSVPQDTQNVVVFVNQSGYDLDRPKRATITNVVDGTAFKLKRASDNVIVYTGTTSGQIADFSSYNPSETYSTEYYVECNSVKSDDFKINKYLMARVSTIPTLNFMTESRVDTWKTGGGGIAWRDSHQFSFELPSLVWQYMANPSAYDRMPYGITHLSDSKFPSLRVQNEPDIIWLMKFGAMTYYDLVANKGKQLHALTKAQLAYFLYIYPEIGQWVDSAFYSQVRDMTVAQWSVSGVSSGLHWYDVSTGVDNNLLATQRAIGTVKGQRPPGYSILPNLLMYEVAVRDGLSNPQQYLTAAINNAKWLVDNVDLNDPAYTKGQRMSEHVTITGLSYLLEKHPSQAPVGTQAKINMWVTKMIARSNNLWDLRKYSATSAGDPTTQWTIGETTNEPGNVAGFASIALAARRVAGNSAQKSRLMELAVSHIDHMFGRNPFGRHFSHDSASEIEGVKRGWATVYAGVGNGDLGSVPAVLDGSPKESAYPFAPTADPGYVEGWVAFNTAWNMSLAYSAAEDVEVKVFNSSFNNQITSANSGEVIGIQLKAPLNLDPTVIETGTVQISTSKGTKANITVTEAAVDDYYFKGTYTIPSDVTYIDVSYGYGHFKKTVRVNVGDDEVIPPITPPPDTTPPSAPTNLAAGTPTTNSVSLSWTASTDDVGVTGYRIEGGVGTVNIGNVTTYTLRGLSPSTAYTLTVKAIDAAGNVSVASNSVTVTTASAASGDIVVDTFTRPGATELGTSETGQTWTEHSGDWRIGSASPYRAYLASTGSSGNSLATIPSGVSDCKVEVEYTQASVNGMLVFRFVDTSNYWYVLNHSSNGLMLFKVVDGVATQVGSNGLAISTSVIRVVMEGDKITVYRAGVLAIATQTDKTHQTATRHGMGGTSTATRFDNFRVFV